MDALERWAGLRGMSAFARAINRGRPSYEGAWYHEVICEHLDLVLRTVRGRPDGLDAVGVFMPPRHGKTLLCSELLPAYAFALDPDLEVISLTYSTDYAKDSRKAVGEIMSTDAYRALCAARVGSGDVEEIDERGRVTTRKIQAEMSANVMRLLRERPDGTSERTRGQYLASSLSGKCTGKGANLFVFDDLVKNAEEASSPTSRRKVEAEIEQTAFTRAYRNSGQVLLMTRWHELDAASFITRKWEEAGLRYAILTLRAQREEDDLSYDPRQPGEYLDMGARFGEEFYRRRRALVGEWAWTSLYQQRPSSRGGRPFPRSVWGRYDPEILGRRDLNAIEGVALSIDPNQVEGGGSYAQIDVWALMSFPSAVIGGYGRREAWKLDEARGKWSYVDFRAHCRAMLDRWAGQVRWLIVESQAAGPQLLSDLRQICEERGIEVVPYHPGRLSKETRAALTGHLFDAGLVLLPSREWDPRGRSERPLVGVEWCDEHLSEWADFPQGRNDDRVDAGVQFLRWAAETQGLVDRPG